MKVLGVLLILLGVFAFVYGGITYNKQRTVLDVGPIEAKVNEKHTVPMPPILGAVALVAGIGLLVAGNRSRSAI